MNSLSKSLTLKSRSASTDITIRLRWFQTLPSVSPLKVPIRIQLDAFKVRVSTSPWSRRTSVGWEIRPLWPTRVKEKVSITHRFVLRRMLYAYASLIPWTTVMWTSRTKSPIRSTLMTKLTESITLSKTKSSDLNTKTGWKLVTTQVSKLTRWTKLTFPSLKKEMLYRSTCHWRGRCAQRNSRWLCQSTQRSLESSNLASLNMLFSFLRNDHKSSSYLPDRT